MDAEAIRGLVLETVHAVAPEAGAIPLDQPLRDAIDLDSMDWLNLVAGLEERLAIRIAPSDHGRLATLNAIVAYAVSRKALASAPSPSPPAQTPGALPCTTFVVRGTPVQVRPMRDDDMALEAEFVRRLSSQSRYQRFMMTGVGRTRRRRGVEPRAPAALGARRRSFVGPKQIKNDSRHI